MDGRELERLAQRNKNWARTGFSQEVPVKRAEVPAERPTPFVTQVSVPAKSESPPAVFKGVVAVKINGGLHGIRKPSESDTPADKLNLELLEFMFQAYGRHGLLPVSDLVAFVERNNLVGYLESQEPSTPKDQEQFDKEVSDLMVKGFDFAKTWQRIRELVLRSDKKFFMGSNLLKLWIKSNERAIIEAMGV